MKKAVGEYALIVAGSLLYAVSTVLFIFPNGLLLGGTSGISVILEAFLPFTPGTILTIINLSLIVLAFVLLGREMATKTLVGSVLTTVFIGLLEKPLTFERPLVGNSLLSAAIGALVIAVASGVMFYVDSSSGGTDVVALIVRKFSGIQIGRALLLTDVVIVLVGGVIAGWIVLLASFVGLLIKTLGIDVVIAAIKRGGARREN